MARRRRQQQQQQQQQQLVESTKQLTSNDSASDRAEFGRPDGQRWVFRTERDSPFNYLEYIPPTNGRHSGRPNSQTKHDVILRHSVRAGVDPRLNGPRVRRGRRHNKFGTMSNGRRGSSFLFSSRGLLSSFKLMLIIFALLLRSFPTVEVVKNKKPIGVNKMSVNIDMEQGQEHGQKQDQGQVGDGPIGNCTSN